MNIEIQLSRKDYQIVTLTMLYRNLFIKIVTAIAVFILIVVLIGLIAAPTMSSSANLIFPFVVLVGFPIMGLISANKNYGSNKLLGEKIDYSFDEDMIRLKGESIYMELAYDKLNKIIKAKRCLLVYVSPQIAHGIPSRYLDESQLLEIKQLANTHGVKNNL